MGPVRHRALVGMDGEWERGTDHLGERLVGTAITGARALAGQGSGKDLFCHL